MGYADVNLSFAEKRQTYSQPSVKAISHDGNELFVGQKAISICIKDLKHRVDQVGVQAVTSADLDGSVKFL